MIFFIPFVPTAGRTRAVRIVMLNRPGAHCAVTALHGPLRAASSQAQSSQRRVQLSARLQRERDQKFPEPDQPKVKSTLRHMYIFS